MPNLTKTIDYFLDNRCGKLESVMKEFYTYLQTLPSKKIKRSSGTNYAILTLVNKYLESINYNIDNISQISINKLLEKYTTKNQVFMKIKHFNTFLYKTNRLSESKYKELIEKKFNESKSFKNPEKKFAIPFERWPECYNQLSGVKRFACYLLFYTGVRPGELINLETTDFIINHKTQEYTLKIQPKYNNGKLIWYPKSNNGIRDIELVPSCIPLIEKYLQIREERGKELNINHNYLLYATKPNNKVKKGDKIKYELNINDWLGKIILDYPNDSFTKCKAKINRHTKCKVKIPHRHISPKTCRYSYLTHVYYANRDKGLDALDEVRKLAGHSNSIVTFEYLNLDKVDQKERKKKALSNAFD